MAKKKVPPPTTVEEFVASGKEVKKLPTRGKKRGKQATAHPSRFVIGDLFYLRKDVEGEETNSTLIRLGVELRFRRSKPTKK